MATRGPWATGLQSLSASSGTPSAQETGSLSSGPKALRETLMTLEAAWCSVNLNGLSLYGGPARRKLVGQALTKRLLWLGPQPTSRRGTRGSGLLAMQGH